MRQCASSIAPLQTILQRDHCATVVHHVDVCSMRAVTKWQGEVAGRNQVLLLVELLEAQPTPLHSSSDVCMTLSYVVPDGTYDSVCVFLAA